MKKPSKEIAGIKQTDISREQAKPIEETEARGLKKQYLQAQHQCKVTFRLPKEAVRDAKAVAVVGEFNEWNLSKNMMKRLKNGDFEATVDLECDKEYRFKYLIDSQRWENDWSADKYAKNEFGGEDSVVVVRGSANK